jgi:hypothetical protein
MSQVEEQQTPEDRQEAEFQNLLRRVLWNEENAWAEFMNLIEPRILLLAAVRNDREPLLCSWRDTRDNVQSVWRMCVMEKWVERFVEMCFSRKQVFGYFRKAIVHVLKRYAGGARRQADMDRKTDHDLALLAAGDQPMPDEVASSAEEYQRPLGRVRVACKDDAQFAVVVRLLDGEGYKEVAEGLGWKPDTLSKAYRRLIEGVRASLYEE